ncbi:hypothetical protein SAMN04488498_12947 [Mesorhizobium albiziae]|uniref:Uncharacterized protein n=1 Tax=Neomesorhizobium albiziae TaxID=335020 RepID=A0A1I4EV63_9HYPH|nr:hypothetical protein GCM10007937_25160 [Mesorhizobium albiziae]SFL08031.1 hypothetical protein SAMN04488498_12947 [Mesorhizobium albiziae]
MALDLIVGRTVVGALSRALPIADGLKRGAGRRIVLSHDLGLVFDDLAEMLLERVGDPGVQLLAATA